MTGLGQMNHTSVSRKYSCRQHCTWELHAGHFLNPVCVWTWVFNPQWNIKLTSTNVRDS